MITLAHHASKAPNLPYPTPLFFKARIARGEKFSILRRLMKMRNMENMRHFDQSIFATQVKTKKIEFDKIFLGGVRDE